MMTEESVGIQQFGEFVKRMEDRFDHVDKQFGHASQLADQRFDSINQRFLDVEKRMEHDAVHVHQRFEQVDKRLDDLHAEMRSLRRTMVGLGVPVIVVLLSAIVTGLVKVLFFSA